MPCTLETDSRAIRPLERCVRRCDKSDLHLSLPSPPHSSPLSLRLSYERGSRGPSDSLSISNVFHMCIRTAAADGLPPMRSVLLARPAQLGAKVAHDTTFVARAYYDIQALGDNLKRQSKKRGKMSRSMTRLEMSLVCPVVPHLAPRLLWVRAVVLETRKDTKP
jgi:hypothetical protein